MTSPITVTMTGRVPVRPVARVRVGAETFVILVTARGIVVDPTTPRRRPSQRVSAERQDDARLCVWETLLAGAVPFSIADGAPARFPSTTTPKLQRRRRTTIEDPLT